MTREQQNEEAFDLLEEALAKGWQMRDGMIAFGDLGPVLDAARAVLMVHRGRDPIMPKRRAA